MYDLLFSFKKEGVLMMRKANPSQGSASKCKIEQGLSPLIKTPD